MVQQHLDSEHPLPGAFWKDRLKRDRLAPVAVLSSFRHWPSSQTNPDDGRPHVRLPYRSDKLDEEFVQELHANVLWMVFCGVPPEEAHFVKTSTLYKFRKHLGPEGTNKIEILILEQLRNNKRISPFMRVDTTAIEKHISYPTEAGLL